MKKILTIVIFCLFGLILLIPTSAKAFGFGDIIKGGIIATNPLLSIPYAGSQVWKVFVPSQKSNTNSKTTTPSTTTPSNSKSGTSSSTSSVVAPDVSDINFPGRFGTADQLVVAVANWFFGFVSAFAVVAIVYSGIMYITSGADTAKTESAKKNLTWAIIGLIIAISAYFIIRIVITELNVL